MNQMLFAERLAHYAQREPKTFIQLDGYHTPNKFDPEQKIDADGDSV